MSEVLQELRSQFRFVVIDSAPLLPFADARALSTLVDGLVFVSRLELQHAPRSAPKPRTAGRVCMGFDFGVRLDAADITSIIYRYYQYG